ncbi:hypothetical protein [Candidatus Avelusimicrobium gallicola]|uniref:Uncharacterized protein n=1 Tax=Candidatus Avelusimicrobium gallicola TaxID=2562704 RepID=A0A1Y4DEY0_9BACT|nr:hypothetical protein [Elusimicrobium sp. An273]OUO57636.1 hypothetical protein B5F75_02345 [Elusimicrobium sp. An273]
MTHTPSFAQQSAAVLFKAFFMLIKTLFVLLALTVGALVAGQSSVAPVSVRLLSAYGMEYAVATFKPYRHLFPEPYLIDLENK